MYFKSATPESVGIKSSCVLNLLKAYEKSGLAMHSVLMARGDKLFCEAYWYRSARTITTVCIHKPKAMWVLRLRS